MADPDRAAARAEALVTFMVETSGWQSELWRVVAFKRVCGTYRTRLDAFEEAERLRSDVAAALRAHTSEAEAELERLRAAIRHTHEDYCVPAERPKVGGRHAPECMLYELGEGEESR